MFRSISTQKCFYRTKNSLSTTLNVKFSYLNQYRPLSQQSGNDEKKTEDFVPFLSMVKYRRAQARKSILVQVQSAQSYKELYSYCNSMGTVKQMHHYSVGVEPMNFIIVEFNSETDVSHILSASSHYEDPHSVPVHSNFLWFRATSKKLPKLKQSKTAVLHVENGSKIVKDLEIKERLKSCDSITNQMQTLYETTKLNDTGTRLRFLTARQIENAVSGMFPNSCALPFGSTVNGCGKMGCDLDLVLRLNNEEVLQLKKDSRLIFHCKATSGSERSSSQRNMETIGDLIQLFLPGCAQVRRILQARVPIIKYYQQLTDVECDLSMSNMSGVHMSDFLYVMGSIDPRVRPLIFTVKKWAQEMGLTSASPGRWITNFSLTLLVLAFLQKPMSSPPILPSLNHLVKLAGPEDNHMTEDGINCTFLRNASNYKVTTKNTESLESLLKEFFEFCVHFDFASKAICLNEAVALTKPEHCALYIINPLERGLNVSKNVSVEEMDRFKIEARNAAWMLESQENSSKTGNWGLLSILESKRKPINAFNLALNSRQGRLMQVSTLFDETVESDEEVVHYKNENVRKQVQNIKKDRRNKLEEIQKLNR